MSAVRVAIIGASGYTGAELLRLVLGHPKLELGYAGAREKAGQRLGAHFRLKVICSNFR